MPNVLQARRRVLNTTLGVYGDTGSRHASGRCHLPPVRACRWPCPHHSSQLPTSRRPSGCAIASGSVAAVLPLAPFITDLDVTLGKRDDLSEWLSSVCKVTLPIAPLMPSHEAPSPLTLASLPCPRSLSRLRALKLCCKASKGELPPFSSFMTPAEHLPAMDTLETLEMGSSTYDVPLLLPSTVDLNGFSSLRQVIVAGTLFAKGTYVKRQQLFKVLPLVVLSHCDLIG
jgi:hypothetical protein